MKKLVYFTDGYPWAPAEIPFIKNELETLAKEYDIELVARLKAQYENSAPLVEVPKNVKLHKYIIENVTGKEKIQSLKYALSDGLYWKEIKRLQKDNCEKALKGDVYSYLTTTYLFMKWLKKEIDINSIDIFYSYWNSYATLGMALEKSSSSNFTLVTRTHGYDLYDERMPYNRQYFKQLVDSKLDKVFFIGDQGREYYMEHFATSKDESKYVINMIGVTKAGKLPEKKDECFRMVSCSSVIPLKRVAMIAEALSDIDDIKIEWIHMGAGALMQDLKEKCSALLDNKNNVSYKLMGRISNNEVREYYDNNYVDCFITTSSTEGSPVSVQEALAYGIPVIGTSVGDVPSLIDGNGIVLGQDCTAEDVAKAIRQMSDMSDKEKKMMRKNAYSKWESKYDVRKNADEFVTVLKK